LGENDDAKNEKDNSEYEDDEEEDLEEDSDGEESNEPNSDALLDFPTAIDIFDPLENFNQRFLIQRKEERISCILGYLKVHM